MQDPWHGQVVAEACPCCLAPRTLPLSLQEQAEPPQAGHPPLGSPSCLLHPRAAPHPKAPGAWAET